MQKHFYLVGVAILLVSIANCAPKTVSSVHVDVRTAVNLPQQTLSPIKFWDWTTQTWTGNNAPYQRIRTEIDQAIARGEDPQELLNQQKGVAQQYSDNPQAQFAWGYVAYKSLPPWHSEYENGKPQKVAALALAKLQATDNYDYVRLRFLLPPDYHTSDLTQLEAKERLLDSLGQRLLQYAPNDADVKYRLLVIDGGILDRNASDLVVKKRALQYAQELIQEKPNVSRYRTLPGGIFTTCWSHTNSATDARAAIASYQDYLLNAPPNEEFRPQAQYLISVLQNALAHPAKIN